MFLDSIGVFDCRLPGVVFNGKKYSSHVNNQSLEQIYKVMLEKLKMEACSVQEHIQWYG